MRWHILALFAFTFAPALAAGREIYVDNVSGDDRQGGHSPTGGSEVGGPCRSIAKALRIAQPSDRIIVANTGVPYRECVTIQGPRHSGSDSYPFYINGNGATLEGTMSLAEAKWEYVRGTTFRTRPARMSHQQLFLDGEPLPRIAVLSSQIPELAPRQWCLADGWLYFACDEHRLPQNYGLSCCLHPAGITLYNCHDVIVENFVVRGFYLDGVNCHDNVTRSDLLGVTSSHNGRSGFSVGGASRVRIDTCTAAGNGVAQVRTEGYSITALVGNTLDPASAPAIVREGGTVVEGE